MLNNFRSIYKEQNYFDKLIYLIIFLLPVFAISVRDWVSGAFSLLFLLAVAYNFKFKNNSLPLAKEEKYFFYILYFYFFIYLLSSVVNGWGEPQTHILGTMLHFLVIIPIFLMFRKLHYLIPVLIAGSVIANIVSISYIYISSSTGIYGPLFSGPMIFLYCLFILPLFSDVRINLILKLGLGALMILSLISIFELGNRSSLIALLFVTILYFIIYPKGKQKIYVVACLVVISSLAYFGNAHLKMRVNNGLEGVNTYLAEKNPAQVTEKFAQVHAVAARFEMWRASQYFVTEDPVLGFGPDEYSIKIQQLIDKNLINSIAQASHPHNAYLHELYAKGFLGLIAMLLVLYYPFYVFIRHYKSNKDIAIIGLSVILSISGFSLTASAAFNNNNFSSIMLIYVSILLVSLFQRKNSYKRVNK